MGRVISPLPPLLLLYLSLKFHFLQLYIRSKVQDHCRRVDNWLTTATKLKVYIIIITYGYTVGQVVGEFFWRHVDIIILF